MIRIPSIEVLFVYAAGRCFPALHRHKNRKINTAPTETATLRTHAAVILFRVPPADLTCPRCNLRPRARRRNWSALRNYERSTGEVLEIDAYHDFCALCNATMPGRGDATAMAVVEDAEADSVQWLIERGRGKETTAQKAHVCYRCGGDIAIGQRYVRVRGGAARVNVALHEQCHRAHLRRSAPEPVEP